MSIDAPVPAVYDCRLHGGAPIIYPWVFTLGVLLSLLWLILFQTDRQAGSAVPDPLPAAVWALASGLLQARLGFAAVYSTYYLRHPLELFWLWQGGLSGAGGLLGGLLGLAVYSRLSATSWVRNADTLSQPALILAMSCWIGCWLDGCAYGLPLDSSLPLVTTADMFATRIARWPTALIGLLPPLAIFVLLFKQGSRQPTGWNAALAFTAIALGILLASLVRADPMPLLLNARLDTLAGLALSIAGALALLISFSKR